MSKKKRIVVTGVTRGLGLAMTEKFVDLGHTVLGCGRSREVIERLQRSFHSPHDFWIVDVTKEAEVEMWAERILEDDEPPDLLINNAATINENAPLWEVSCEEFSRVIDVNIKGVANTIRHLVPAMIARRKGVIINFSSGWGRSSSADVAPYCATKWAIEGLTQALAQELPSGMAAVPLNPGVIDTEMLRSCLGDEASAYPKPSQWAESAVPFLLKLGPSDNGKSLSAT